MQMNRENIHKILTKRGNHSYKRTIFTLITYKKIKNKIQICIKIEKNGGDKIKMILYLAKYENLEIEQNPDREKLRFE